MVQLSESNFHLSQHIHSSNNAPVIAASLAICGPRLHRAIRGAQGVLPVYEGGGCDQSIGSTVSDAIVRSWLWSTATRSSPLGTGKEDFTFNGLQTTALNSHW